MIRMATPNDAAGCQTIYAPIVRETIVTYEVDPPSVEEMRRRIEAVLPLFPWLVDEQEGMIIGYAYGSQHRSRTAYQWSVEVSVYVHESHRRQGVGRRLCVALLDRLRGQGYRTALAGIGLPNMASVELHRDIGFSHVGTYHNVGFKMGRWLDTDWWELSLQDLPDPPPAPRGASSMRGH